MPVETLAANITALIINPIIALIFAAGFLVFVWGVVQFLSGLAGTGEAADEGKQHMLWGVIGMAIMIAAVGILRLIGNTIGVPV